MLGPRLGIALIVTLSLAIATVGPGTGAAATNAPAAAPEKVETESGPATSPAAVPAAEEPRVAVLLYHDVHPQPYSPYVVTPERLASDLRWFLDQGWQPLTLARFADWITGQVALTGDWFLLTFDDGYLGWAEHGYPVLQEAGVPAVQFVITGRLGREDWADGPPKLSESRLAAIAGEELVSFGDHTWDLHRLVKGQPLVRQVSAEEVAKDLDMSRSVLANLTGADPVALAWPYGSYAAVTPAAEAVARDRYELIFLAVDGFARSGEPHRIPRFGLDWRRAEDLPHLFARRAGPQGK